MPARTDGGWLWYHDTTPTIAPSTGTSGSSARTKECGRRAYVTRHTRSTPVAAHLDRAAVRRRRHLHRQRGLVGGGPAEQRDPALSAGLDHQLRAGTRGDLAAPARTATRSRALADLLRAAHRRLGRHRAGAPLDRAPDQTALRWDHLHVLPH